MRIFDVGVIRMLAVGRWITEGETERFYTEMSGDRGVLGLSAQERSKGRSGDDGGEAGCVPEAAGADEMASLTLGGRVGLSDGKMAQWMAADGNWGDPIGRLDGRYGKGCCFIWITGGYADHRYAMM